MFVIYYKLTPETDDMTYAFLLEQTEDDARSSFTSTHPHTKIEMVERVQDEKEETDGQV